MKKIAVITAYNNEEFRLIEKANHSVVSQSNNEFFCDHIIVVDGSDSNKNLEKIKCKKVELNQNHNDNGNTPRSVGTNMAISQDYDFIMYLDSDNWFMEGHVNSLYQLIKNENKIGCSFRSFYTMEDKKLNFLEDTDCLEKKHADTSCYLIPRIFYKYINIWHLIPKQTSQWCDRIFFNNLIRYSCPILFSEKHTVAFRTLYDTHYLDSNTELPKNVKVSLKISQKAVEYFEDENNKRNFINLFGFSWKPEEK